jgi:hypothetical protein
MTTKTLTIPNSITPVDLLLFKANGSEVAGLVEQTLADPRNRWLGAFGPFPPRGTIVTFEQPVPISQQPARTTTRLYD